MDDGDGDTNFAWKAATNTTPSPAPAMFYHRPLTDLTDADWSSPRPADRRGGNYHV